MLLGFREQSRLTSAVKLTFLFALLFACSPANGFRASLAMSNLGSQDLPDSDETEDEDATEALVVSFRRHAVEEFPRPRSSAPFLLPRPHIPPPARLAGCPTPAVGLSFPLRC